MRAKSILKSVRDVRACSLFLGVQCADARVRVRAKSILKSVRDVRACGSFLGVRCATVFLHIFGTKLPENTILEHLFLLYNVLSCFRTSYFVLEHPKMLKNCLKFAEKILKNCGIFFEKMLIYQKCGCGCEVRPLQI